MTAKNNKTNKTNKSMAISLIQKKIGSFIHKKRKLADVSILDLAQAIGISEEHLIEIENGHKKVPLQQIYTIANYLNINPEELIRLFNSFSIEI